MTGIVHELLTKPLLTQSASFCEIFILFLETNFSDQSILRKREEMKKMTLGAFEELVLLTVGVLKDNAYGVTIREELEENLKKDISLGALYAALQRLEDKGWVDSRVGGITEKQGGRRKQYYDITEAGVRALHEVRSLRNELFDRLPLPKVKFLDL